MNRDINLVLIHAQILVQNYLINTLLVLILHTMIVTDLAMTEIISLNIKISSTFCRCPYKYYLRSAIAPLATTIPLLDNINHHIVLLLSHAMVAIAIDHTLILKATLTILINPLLVLLNNPIHYFIIPLPQNLSSK